MLICSLNTIFALLNYEKVIKQATKYGNKKTESRLTLRCFKRNEGRRNKAQARRTLHVHGQENMLRTQKRGIFVRHHNKEWHADHNTAQVMTMERKC